MKQYYEVVNVNDELPKETDSYTCEIHREGNGEHSFFHTDLLFNSHNKTWVPALKEGEVIKYWNKPYQPTTLSDWEILSLADKYILNSCNLNMRDVKYAKLDFFAGYKSAQQLPGSEGDGWISVKDRLPEIKQDVLVTDGEINKIGCMVKYGMSREWSIEGVTFIEPTFWQPIPKLP